jgi:DNA-binding CsgD family transcriptional regulator
MLTPKPAKCDSEVAMVETLTKSGGFSFGCIGLVDCNDGRLLDTWVSRRTPDPAAVKSENDLKTVSRALRASLALARDNSKLHSTSSLVPNRDFEIVTRIMSRRYMIGIGDRVGDIASIAAFSTDCHMPGVHKKQQGLLDVGVTYANQVLHEHLTSEKEYNEFKIQESILQSISSGLAAVEANGSVHYINNRAIDWLNRNEELNILNGQITSLMLTNRASLQKALTRATSGRRKISIIRLESPRGLLRTITVLPIDKTRRIALLVFGDKNWGDTAVCDQLLTTLGLTLAERRLAQQLLSGKTLAEAAVESNLTISTARSYLKMIFAKTGIHRQSELITLYYRLLPPVRLEQIDAQESSRSLGTDKRIFGLPGALNIMS